MALTLSFQTPRLFANQQITYDPYDSVWMFPEAHDPAHAKKRDRNKLLARILEQPVRPIGFAVGKPVEFVEQNHIHKKAVWAFDELLVRGIHPSLKGPTDGAFSLKGPYVRVEVDKLLGVEIPGVDIDVKGGWTQNHKRDGTTTQFGADYEIEIPQFESVYHEGHFSYFKSSSESFFGQGNTTSLGDWSSYKPREVKLVSVIGSHLTKDADAKVAFIYQNMNIGNGRRDGVGKIKEVHPSVRGIDGGNLIGGETTLTHDTRDHSDDPTKGGHRQLAVGYFHDIDATDLHYLRIAGEVSQFFTLGSDRRVLALRFRGEKNQELGAGNVPFFNMVRLGGHRISTGSELLRSYRPNRYFDKGVFLWNAEYRYRVYEYGDFKTDAAALVDVGEVFEEINEFDFDDLRVSYGGNFSIKFRRKTLFTFTVAHGNEGWRMGAATGASF